MTKNVLAISKKDKVTLSNVLNEMFYEEKMTLQELRFFLVYLARINPKDPNSSAVTFPLEEYAELLGVELNEKQISAATRKLLRYVVCVRQDVLEKGVKEHFKFVQLFSEANLKKMEDNKWYFTFECHAQLREHIFDLMREFTSFEVWNAINLKSFQDARLYMLLKQYLKIGTRTIPLVELKKMLGIDVNAYPEYKIFTRAVLKKSQKALKLYTDIKFEFEAVGRPAHSVKFIISSNDAYTLPAFLEESTAVAEVPTPIDEFEDVVDDRVRELREPFSKACDKEFNDDQIELLVNDLSKLYPIATVDTMCEHLEEAYRILKVRAHDTDIPNRFAYVRGILRNQAAQRQQ